LQQVYQPLQRICAVCFLAAEAARFDDQNAVSVDSLSRQAEQASL